MPTAKSLATEGIKNLLVWCLLAAMIWYLAADFAGIGKGTDFPDFYAAARIVRDGLGRQLYDPATQAAYQARYVQRTGSFYIHPAFETLLYLPFALMSLKTAYLLWTLLSAALLVAAARLLQALVNPDWSWQLVLACSLLFVPVLLCLLQGQDSILLLFLLLLALRAARNKQDFLAGCLLACGLFKFHLVLPLFLMFAITRKGRFSAGFAATGLILAAISIAISGWGSVEGYPRFLVHLSQLPMPGNSPSGMANLHGLLQHFNGSFARVGLWLTAISSVLIFAWTMRKLRHRQADEDSSFAIAVTAALLVGYHLSPHDLVLLLIPLSVLAGTFYASEAPKWWRVSAIATATPLFLPLVHPLLLRQHSYYLLCIPVFALFLLLNVHSALGRPSFQRRQVA